YAFVAVDIGDAGATRGCRHEAGIVCEVPSLRVELADIDNPRTDSSAQHRKLDRLPRFVVGKCNRSVHHVTPVHRSTSVSAPCGPLPDSGRKIGFSGGISKPAYQLPTFRSTAS